MINKILAWTCDLWQKHVKIRGFLVFCIDKIVQIQCIGFFLIFLLLLIYKLFTNQLCCDFNRAL